jgi:BirA family biotin operon repressor/biotin-[acetyl-CoA-carboxylase] ligase
MAFSANRFLAELRSLRFGCALRCFAEVTSTIDLAWEWLEEGGPEGGAVIADRQTQGRGRQGRSWASPEGGLWLSVLARPALPIAEAGRLGVALSLSAADAVSLVAGVKAQVKWPNDVVLGDRKLAGILVETRTEGAHLTQAVLSIGVNVNLDLAALPEEVRDSATTLLAETGQPKSAETVAARLLEALERRWPAVLGDGQALVEAWEGRDALANREVEVRLTAESLRGEARGIDPAGALRLWVEGEERRVTVGEIGQVRPQT